MKKNTIYGILAVIVIILIGLSAWQVNSSAKSDSSTVKIAANLPLSGPFATYGDAVRKGAIMALKEIEAIGGISYQIDWQDNASDPKTAVSVFQMQKLSSPSIYISGVKPQTMAIDSEVAELGIPHFVWIFDAYINKLGGNNFRTWVSYKIEPPIYMDYARRLKAQKVAITYVQLPHTIEEFEKILIPEMKAAGIEVVVEPYNFGKNDFKDIAQKMAASDPDLIILNGFQGDLVGLIRSLRPLGAITDGNTIATYDLLDAADILGADEIEGIRIVAPKFETRPNEASIKKWSEKFEAAYGHPPLYTHAFAYDMMTAINIAAESLDLPASNSAWVEALSNIQASGVTGSISFDDDGDMLTPLEVGVYRNGELIPDLKK